ncbi:hypothetical protein [Sinosporangium siamense]|uniref:Ig-like domain-containing protein n=1 Tax=Sinosporangium siamense TaxID=1367973 RepID=A0A919RJH9_9ACTN|nr:hypothetical protein [Sinosporangium siamense]GII94407.1 hypothetical protein Ssi02_46380 [Sinosporangium siamense]
MARTTPFALSALAAAAVLIGGPAAAAAADDGDDRPAAAGAALRAPHPIFFGTFVTVPPNQNLTASVSCPAGQVPTGGGGTTSAFRIFFTDSFASGNTWSIRGTNTNTVNESIRAFVVCTAL